MWTVTFSLIIIQGSTATQIFGASPYNLNPATVGNLVGIAPLIGAALGTLFGGYMCDLLAKFMAKKNSGVYEPEYRLLVLVLYLITIIPGTFGLGMAIESEQSAIVCAVFLGTMNFAIGVGCTGIISYSNDVLQYRAGENFGLTMVCSNFSLINPCTLIRQHSLSRVRMPSACRLYSTTFMLCKVRAFSGLRGVLLR